MEKTEHSFRRWIVQLKFAFQTAQMVEMRSIGDPRKLNERNHSIDEGDEAENFTEFEERSSSQERLVPERWRANVGSIWQMATIIINQQITTRQEIDEIRLIADRSEEWTRIELDSLKIFNPADFIVSLRWLSLILSLSHFLCRSLSFHESRERDVTNGRDL